MGFIFFLPENNDLTDNFCYRDMTLDIFGAIIVQVLVCIEKVSYGTARITACATYLRQTWLRDTNLAMSEIIFGGEMEV